jgi:hypothetical protein
MTAARAPVTRLLVAGASGAARSARTIAFSKSQRLRMIERLFEKGTSGCSNAGHCVYGAPWRTVRGQAAPNEIP